MRKHNALEIVDGLVGQVHAFAPSSQIGAQLVRVAGGFGIGGLVRSHLSNRKPDPETEARDAASAALAAYAYRNPLLADEWLDSEISRSLDYQATRRSVEPATDAEIVEHTDAVEKLANPKREASIFGDVEAEASKRATLREDERLVRVETRRDDVARAVHLDVTKTALSMGSLDAFVDDRTLSTLLERLFAMARSCAINATATMRTAKMPSSQRRAALEVRACEFVGNTLDAISASLDTGEDGFVPEYEAMSNEGRDTAELDRHHAEDESQAAEARARSGWFGFTR